jgi:hypothetical protein
MSGGGPQIRFSCCAVMGISHFDMRSVDKPTAIRFESCDFYGVSDIKEAFEIVGLKNEGSQTWSAQSFGGCRAIPVVKHG